MNRWVPMILAYSLVCGCATTTPPREAAPSTKGRKSAEMNRYLDCTLNYANQYATSKASASEIADAAIATCETYLLELQGVITTSLAERYETQAGIQAAHGAVKELIHNFRLKSRGQVISKVLELRDRK